MAILSEMQWLDSLLPKAQSVEFPGNPGDTEIYWHNSKQNSGAINSSKQMHEQPCL